MTYFADTKLNEPLNDKNNAIKNIISHKRMVWPLNRAYFKYALQLVVS